MRRLIAPLVFTWATSAACIESNWQTCEDARQCLSTQRCDGVHHRCASPEEPCFELGDGVQCPAAGGTGLCEDGICVVAGPARCGDGRRDYGEACDGAELGDTTCASEGYYFDDPGLRCTAECTLDATGCSGYCNDGERNGTEFCDPTDPESAITGYCVWLGMSAGIRTCRADCRAEEIGGCMRFGWDVHDADLDYPDGGRIHRVVDLWGAHGRLVAVGEVRGVRWFNGFSWDDLGAPELPEGEFPTAVWGASTRDIWVGSSSTLMHWNGADWVATDNPASPVEPTDMWGSSADDIYAVSIDGLVLHYDGSLWSIDLGVAPGVSLNGVSGTSARDIYIVGDKGLVLHHDGQAWSPVELAGAGDLTSVWASSPDDVWIAGNRGEGAQVFHFDGSRWAEISSPLLATRVDLRIAGRGPRDLWAVSAPSDPLLERRDVLHFDGRSWLETSVEGSFSTIWADAETIAVGGEDAGVALWQGTGRVALPGLPAGGGWDDAWAVDSAATYLVGGDASGRGAIYTPSEGGRSWSMPERLVSVAGASRDDVYALGRFGTVYHFDGTTWAEHRPAPDRGVAPARLAAKGSDVFLLEVDVGRGSLAVYRAAADRWVLVPGTESTDARLVDTIGGQTAFWAAGDDAFFIGGLDVLARFDGESWVHVSPSELTMGGRSGSLLVVGGWAAGPGDSWALAENVLFHFDGARWDVVGVGPVRYRDIAGTRSDDIFLLGVNGDMRHYDGRSWVPMRSLESDGLLGTLSVAPSLIVAAGREVKALHRTRPWNCSTSESACDNSVDDDCDGVTDAMDADCPPATPTVTDRIRGR